MLPEACESFFFATGNERAMTTKIAYAKEYIQFFDYMISVSPTFCEYENQRDITLEDIAKITSEDISRYITLYMGDPTDEEHGHKERTCARKRAALSSLFNYFVDNRKLEYNPVYASTKVKIHDDDTVIYLDFEQQNKFLKSIESGDDLSERQKCYHDKYALRDSALVLLLLDTGMRVSELHGLNIENVDFDKMSAFVTRKGGKHQHLYFADDVKEALTQYIESRKLKYDIKPESPLFVTLEEKRLSVRAIEVLVKKYAKASLSDGSKYTPHKMRSSFAMGFYEETKDILALQRKLGHKNLTTTNIYAKATDKKMQETRSIVFLGRQKAKNKTDSPISFEE